MIADQRAAILALLGQAGVDDWVRPTRCTDWSLKDVVAHLVEGELNVGMIYRGEITDPGFVDPTEGIERWAALPGEAVRSALWQHGTATQRVLGMLDEERWRAPIRAFGCSTIGRLVRLQLFESVIHGSDLSEALEAEPIWGERIDFAAEFVVRAAPATFARHGFPPLGRFGFQIGERYAVLHAADGRWQSGFASPEPGLAGGSLSAPDLVMAVTGRRPIDEVLERSRIEGDPAETRRLLECWQVLA